MEKYVVLEKAVGETPLSCAEAWRTTQPAYINSPLAYAGRLDPMASGKLLVLIGDECKNQTSYHSLDKEYEFSVLLGIGSDTHDVLGRLKLSERLTTPDDLLNNLNTIISNLVGLIKLPYPHFSAKTIKGKPLHMWTLENRLHEIEIPTKESEVYSLEIIKTETITKNNLVEQALKKINSIPPVTELRKALGNDFRRVDVRQDWENIKSDNFLLDTFQIIHLRCIASSGTYMRSLAEIIGKKLDTQGLAWHIHRTSIGTYNNQEKTWTHQF
jgi:tRNA pseudouridine(55) synthase